MWYQKFQVNLHNWYQKFGVIFRTWYEAFHVIMGPWYTNFHVILHSWYIFSFYFALLVPKELCYFTYLVNSLLLPCTLSIQSCCSFRTIINDDKNYCPLGVKINIICMLNWMEYLLKCCLKHFNAVCVMFPIRRRVGLPTVWCGETTWREIAGLF